MDIFDVAAYVLHKAGPMTTMKMQKLLYYSQAWSLAWDDKPLFPSRFEAWANGPVAPEYFAAHRGEFNVSSEARGDYRHVTGDAKDTVDAVLESYADKSPEWLSERTHMESPWIEARSGLAAGVRGNREITHAAMREFYSSL